MAHESKCAVMGTTAHIVTVGSEPDLLQTIEQRLHDLDRRWTRFTDDSELARLNSAAGSITVVEHDTFCLVASAVDGWKRTNGRYDPTVAKAIVANGYDRTFDSIRHVAPTEAEPAPGCADIELLPETSAVWLPEGASLDFGGIAKGFAADLLCREVLSSSSADGVCINIGGDLRVAGQAPTNAGWRVELAVTAKTDHKPVQISLADGAVCTSRIDRRSWNTNSGRAHHLLDPLTGSPSQSGLVAVTVVAGSAASAEVITKAVIIGGLADASELVDDFDAGAIAIGEDGALHYMGNIRDFQR